MASDINSVTIVGRLTRDAELRYTPAGTAMSLFSIASNRSVKKGDAWVDEASFFDITLWNKQAEGLNKFLTKGTQVAIEGELKQERWNKDGKNFSKVVISVGKLQLLGGGTGAPQRTEAHAGAGPARGDDDHSSDDAGSDWGEYEDDIPF